jgi:hypothetical protein
MDFEKTWCEVVDRVHFVRGRIQWWVLLKTVRTEVPKLS